MTSYGGRPHGWVFSNSLAAAAARVDAAVAKAGIGGADLTPLLLERSLQARLLVPMAISLAFGVLFATFITLLLVPALYASLEDFKRALEVTWL